VHPDFQQRIELHGTEGTIIIEGTEDLWIEHWETFKDGKRETVSKIIGVSGAHAVLEEGGEGHQRQLEDFVAAIRDDKEPLVNGPEGRRSLSVARAVYESAQSNREIEVD
jgi:predicted dehydrogenase